MLKNISLLYIVFFISPLWIMAQNKAAVFTAETDAKEITLNSYLEVDFILENAKGSNFQSPNFQNAKVISGPSTSSSTTIINGQISQKMSYSYVLQPMNTGTIIIPSASINANNLVLRTKPISVKVVKGQANLTKKAGAPAAGDFFVRAEPSSTTAKIGQQILLDYKLYTAVNIESYNVLEEADYQGFYARDIQRYNDKTQRETVNGQQYTTKVLKRVALFPQQAGKLTIAAMDIQLGISSENPTQRNSFFFNRNIQRIPYKTEPVEITVTALPPDAPPSFSGAVGLYTSSIEINRTTLTTDNDLSIRVTLIGDGDIKRIQAPNVDLPLDSFELYDPRIVDESSFEKQGQLEGQKIIEYLAVPKYAGNYVIQPQFTYFDTDKEDYVTIKAQKYNITVQQGTNKTKEEITTSTTTVEDIRHIKLETHLSKKGSAFFGSGIFWILSLLPLFFLGGVVILHRKQVKLNNVDGSVLKSRGARKMAEKRLANAEKHLQANASGAFYDEISAASLGYISDKLHIPKAQLSKHNVQEKMKILDVGEASIEKFMSVLKTCEMARFAGMDNTSAMKETYENAAAAIIEIEEKVKEGQQVER